MRIWGKICPKCGGKYNIHLQPTSSTAGPRYFKCEWCDYTGPVTELKDDKPAQVRSYHRKKPRNKTE